MQMTLQDRSNYFKGLLLLIRKDRLVTQQESSLMLRAGKALGFEREFCQNAINEILENTFIVDTPPVFSRPEIAERFIKDGIRLSLVDHAEIHPSELSWLQSVTVTNGLDPGFLSGEIRRRRNDMVPDERLDVDDLLLTDPVPVTPSPQRR